MLDLW